MTDIRERALWPRYLAVYQDIVRHTSTPAAPWHVVPADHKWFARVVIGLTIVTALDSLDLHFPRADKASLRGVQRSTQGAGARKQGRGEEVGEGRESGGERRLERDDFRMVRHRAPAFCLSINS